jgi:solute carrier family 35 (GDP-fucose transporter), member C1
MSFSVSSAKQLMFFVQMVFVNKAVLNHTPELPLLFLFNQMIVAVILLHLSAAFSSRIEIPRLDLSVAKKLIPVVLVNIVGLIFNTLCLRGVEASFFQVLLFIHRVPVSSL